MFNEDYGDMKGICKEGEFVEVLCEECGPIWVDHLGKRVGKSNKALKDFFRVAFDEESS